MNFLDKLLTYYNIDIDDYNELKNPSSLLDLPDTNNIKGMDKVVERIHKAINNKEKIMIYGDYDCDGICATSIMVKTFQKLNYKVGYIIPSRYIDGYGLNEKNAEKIAKANYKLIICVDNGITAYEAINKAKELGSDVIVIDHHEIGDKINNAVGIIHPIVSDISPIIGSGGFMALLVSKALLNNYDPYLLTLAGLSTITDCMELKGYNRHLVRLALSYFDNYHFYQLESLKDHKLIDESTFSMEIGPKINAVGRIYENYQAMKVVELLTSDDKNNISSLSNLIKEINENKKALLNDATKELESISFDKGICLNTNIKEGFLGLLANKLLNKYNVPTMLFTKSENNMLKGSMRSKNGFDCFKALTEISHLIVTFGGHSGAAGVTIKEEDFASFKDEFIKLCEKYPFIDQEKYIEIDLKDINFDNYNIYKVFKPFGQGNKEPKFLIKNVPTKGLNFVSFGKHLSTELSLNTKLLGFNMPEIEMKKKQFIDIYGTFFLSEFRERITLEFRIDKFE